MSISENICIEFECDKDEDIDLPRLVKLIEFVCSDLDALNAHVQISIVDDAQMIEVHRQFLNQDHTTDVMSFDLSDEFEDQRDFQIIVNIDMARRQAQKRGHSTQSELALYMTHGLLHQLGYDDLEPEQARQMHEKEDAILQNNGFGVIYHKESETEE